MMVARSAGSPLGSIGPVEDHDPSLLMQIPVFARGVSPIPAKRVEDGGMSGTA